MENTLNPVWELEGLLHYLQTGIENAYANPTLLIFYTHFHNPGKYGLESHLKQCIAAALEKNPNLPRFDPDKGY